jgi:hypothetical protein
MKSADKNLAITVALLFFATLPSCAKVGSEKWCKKMEDKSVADWTAREAKDYAKHCVFE